MIQDNHLAEVTLDGNVQTVANNRCSVTVGLGKHSIAAVDKAGNRADFPVELATKLELNMELDRVAQLNEEAYTTESWNSFLAAKQAAEEVRNSTTAAQEQINTAAIELKKAVDMLVPKEETPTAPVITDAGRSLSLDDIVSINHYVTVTGLDSVDPEKNGGMLIWSAEPADVSAPADVVKEGLRKGTDKDGNVIYGQSTDGIAVKAYADDLWMTIYVKDADGSKIYGPVTRYSVRDYCLAAIDKNAAVRKRPSGCCTSVLPHRSILATRLIPWPMPELQRGQPGTKRF